MNNKDLVTADVAIKELIGNWLFWGLILHFVYFILIKLITDHIEIGIIKLIFAVLLNFITVFYIWKISTEKTFKNKMPTYNDLPKIIKSITIFTIILCIIMPIINFSIMGEVIEQASQETKKIGAVIETKYYETEKNNFEQNIEKTIEEFKYEIYTYLIVYQILITIIYLYMIIVEKKRLLNYIAIDQNYLEHIDKL